MATKKPTKKSTSISVDFEGVEAGGGSAVPEGNYAVEVDEVERKTSENSGADYLAITFKVSDGGYKGKKLFHNCSLQPQALFNLRGLLEALGFDVPDGPMDLDITDLVGESCGVAVAHEKYEGKDKARCVEFFTTEQLEERGGSEEEEEKPPKKPAKAEKETPKPAAKKTAKKAAKKEEPEFEEGDEVTFTDDEGDEQTGTVTGVDGDTFTVTVGKGKKATEWELEADDLTKVEE